MNLLVTGAWKNAKNHIRQLEQMGHDVVFMQQEKEILPCSYEWVEGVICNGLFLVHPIENFENLRYIQLTSAGLDRVPLDYINSYGIEIHNAHSVYSIPMAEWTLSGVLQLYKKARFFWENQKKHLWIKDRELLELSGKTVCIIGCGDVGNECAKRFRAFGCHVTGINRTFRTDDNYSEIVGFDRIREVFPLADIVILSLALTEDTRHFMDRKKLSWMKPGALLVNSSRGAMVDTQSLINAMTRLGGAVLDVFEEEPLEENSPLWEMENVILTPHNSFVGDGNDDRIDNMILNNLKPGSENEKTGFINGYGTKSYLPVSQATG